MAYTEKEIIGKIGDLLVEINEEYAVFQQSEGDSSRDLQLGLLIAKTKYLSAQLEVLNIYSSPVFLVDAADAQEDKTSDEQNNADDTAEEVIFTPPVEIEEKEADIQQTVEEIFSDDQGQEEYDAAIEENDEPIVEVEEYVADEEQKEVDSEEVIANEEEEVSSQGDNLNFEFDDISDEESSVDEEAAVQQEEVEVEQPVDNIAQEVTTEENTQQVFVEEVVQEEKQVEVPVAKEQVEEKPVEEVVTPTRPLTLNELIQQQKKAGLTNANQFNTTADKATVLDLKTAINLNDKLLFIKDLFNGYSLAYTEAMEILNRFDNFAEADAFLQTNYAIKNNWTSKPQTVGKLYDILRKKFN